MKQKTHSEKYLRHRKFLMVVPLLTLPFITMIFYVMGGGRGTQAGATTLSTSYGLNMQLPDAQLKDDGSLNKMSFYDQAASDSIKHAALLKDDPYSNVISVGNINELHKSSDSIGSLQLSNLNKRISGTSISRSGLEYQDPNEEKVYRKLAALNKAMDQASTQPPVIKDYGNTSPSSIYPSTSSADVTRLERMLQAKGNNANDEDPEVAQLNGMLDKIMDIQHPDRVIDKIKQSSKEHQTQVYPVTLNKKESDISVFERIRTGHSRDTVIRGEANGFFSLVDKSNDDLAQNSIEAVIPETASLVSGSTVKMMLKNDVFIKGELIPRGTYVYGTASVNDERLKIVIQNIRYQNALFPVKLSVFDLDGMEGVFIPGAISRDVAKSSVEQVVQGINIPSVDPSISVQAASAGVQAAKSLLTKKAKLVKVYVTAGYKILLKESTL
jgi:conjugative transposon TraM protein